MLKSMEGMPIATRSLDMCRAHVDACKAHQDRAIEQALPHHTVANSLPQAPPHRGLLYAFGPAAFWPTPCVRHRHAAPHRVPTRHAVAHSVRWSPSGAFQNRFTCLLGLLKGLASFQQ